MSMLGDLSFKDIPDECRMDVLREAARNSGRFDYCEFREMVNLLGGDYNTPACEMDPEYAGDNMAWLGFKKWHEYATFSVIEDKWKLPTFSGVYAVTCACKGKNFLERTGYLHTIYVGSAKNIAQRVSNPGHWYQRAQNRFRGRPIIVGLYVLPTTDYRIYERSLIQVLRPFFNIHHRNG